MFLDHNFNGIIEELIFIQMWFFEVIQGLVNANDFSIFETGFKFVVMRRHIDGADALEHQIGTFPAKMVQFVAEFVSFSRTSMDPMVNGFIIDFDGAMKNLAMELEGLRIWSWIYALGEGNDSAK